MSLSYSQRKQISDRYAKAAYRHAAEKKAAETVLSDLESVCAALKESPDLARLIQRRDVKDQTMSDFFNALLKDADPATRDVMGLLIRKSRLALLEMITDCYRQQLDEAQGVIPVKVTSARKLKAAELKELQAVLQKETKQSIRLSTSVRSDLIGGVIIQTPARRLDASVAGQLKRLHHRLGATQ